MTTTAHHCPFPASGCTGPDCDIAADRFDERVVEALYRVDREHRITCTGPGEVTCLQHNNWHSWQDHRRHVAEAQLVELKRVHLLRKKD